LKSAPSLVSTEIKPKQKEAVDIVYCNASIDNTSFYLILDTGSLTSVMSKAFADKLNRHIEKPSNIYFSDINGGKKRSLGIINNIPLQLSDIIIPINVEVNDAQGYAVIAGVDWLNKVQGIIDLKKGQFKFTWDNKSYILPITCWEKPQYNNSEPIPINNSNKSDDLFNQASSSKTNSDEISEDEYESSDDEKEESKGFLVIGNSNEKPILEINNTQVKYKNETFHNYNFYSQQTNNYKKRKCCCAQSQKNCSKCIQLRETISCFVNKEDLNETNSSLSSVDNPQLQQFLENYDHMFSKGMNDLGKTTVDQHQIITENVPPIHQKAYRMSPAEHEFIQQELDSMLENGLISPSKSPWSSFVVLVKKKNGKLRLCIDYRKLNKITKRDVYPLPRIDEILDTLKGAKWFSTLDLASGYWQVEMKPENREKTAFITKYGLFEFNVMPFGLTNAPATFQRVMDKIFSDLKNKFILVYLDDITIYSKTFEEHLDHLKEVFKRLQNAGLKLGKDKCCFGKQQLAFL